LIQSFNRGPGPQPKNLGDAQLDAPEEPGTPNIVAA
jgi:hypothetical protein